MSPQGLTDTESFSLTTGDYIEPPGYFKHRDMDALGLTLTFILDLFRIRFPQRGCRLKDKHPGGDKINL